MPTRLEQAVGDEPNYPAGRPQGGRDGDIWVPAGGDVGRKIGADVVPIRQEGRHHDGRSADLRRCSEDFTRGGTQHVDECHRHRLVQQCGDPLRKVADHGGPGRFAGAVRDQEQSHAAPERSSIANR